MRRSHRLRAARLKLSSGRGGPLKHGYARRRVAFEGIEARPVDVQVQISPGNVAFLIVGLADKAVAESRERVRSALIASGLALPAKRIIVNLAPADLPKEQFGQHSLIGYRSRETNESGLHRMSRNPAADHDRTHSVQNAARSASVLLAAVGLSLIGAGALLWWRYGDAIFVENPILAALAWCF